MATKIMLIRHAEKADGTTVGVTMVGREDPRELSVRGWQRSGALLGLFGPASDSTRGLATPKTIFAARPSAKSIRSVRTVEALADALSIRINADQGDGDEAKLVQGAMDCDGTVLVAWKHDGLPKLAAAIPAGEPAPPLKWPDDRFDLVWVFDRIAASRLWHFRQVPQLLLPGDRPDPIP